MRALGDASRAGVLRELGRVGFLFDRDDTFALRGLAFAGAAGATGCTDPSWQRNEV